MLKIILFPFPAQVEDGRRDQTQAAGGGVHGRLLQLVAGVQADVEPGEAALHHRPRDPEGRAQVREERNEFEVERMIRGSKIILITNI